MHPQKAKTWQSVCCCQAGNVHLCQRVSDHLCYSKNNEDAAKFIMHEMSYINILSLLTWSIPYKNIRINDALQNNLCIISHLQIVLSGSLNLFINFRSCACSSKGVALVVSIWHHAITSVCSCHALQLVQLNPHIDLGCQHFYDARCDDFFANIYNANFWDLWKDLLQCFTYSYFL